MSAQQQKKSKSKYSVENFDSATEGCESFMFSQRGSGESLLLANLLFLKNGVLHPVCHE